MTFGTGAWGELSWGQEAAAAAPPPPPPTPGAAAVWAYELLPGITAGDMLTALYQANIAGTLKVDVRYVNGIQIKGIGTESDPWNPV